MKKKNGLRLPEVVRDTIIELGAVFERRGKHTILWRLPNGRLIGYSQTTSDGRSAMNFRSMALRKAEVNL